MPNNPKSGVAQSDAVALLKGSPAEQSPRRVRRNRICIVGQGSISQNPRVVKEADALAAAGYDVVTLFPQWSPKERAMDLQLIERASWQADTVDLLPTFGGRLRRWLSGMQVHLFQKIAHWTLHFPFAELARSRYFFILLWRAIRNRSDLYIGHYTASLPVVAWAARWTGAKFAFDFEDFHRGEALPAAPESLPNRLIAALEDRYLPAASFITAASWGIANEVAKTTGLPEPTTVLNVFSWADRASLPAPRQRPSNAALSLYWFSQIVSLDRGLQDIIGAMALMRGRAELHIRGDDSGGSIEILGRLANEHGISRQVHFHSIISPGELLASAAEHDVGLCLEVPATLNKDNCISNKIFVYMLAGLAVVASRTRGQAEVLKVSPEIGSLYDHEDIGALAAILDRYDSDRELLARTKAAALTAARDRWNWERESKLLVSTVNNSILPDSEQVARVRTI
jgi:glycosyltransferase involved in cell wall biosynthesis